MDYLFTILFKVLAGLLVIGLIFGILKHLSYRRLIQRVLHSPDEIRQRYILFDSTLIEYYKKLFWMAPISLMVPAADYVFLHKWFAQLALMEIALYIFAIEDFIYRKAFLKAIGDSLER